MFQYWSANLLLNSSVLPAVWSCRGKTKTPVLYCFMMKDSLLYFFMLFFTFLHKAPKALKDITYLCRIEFSQQSEGLFWEAAVFSSQAFKDSRRNFAERIQIVWSMVGEVCVILPQRGWYLNSRWQHGEGVCGIFMFMPLSGVGLLKVNWRRRCVAQTGGDEQALY